MEILNKYYLPMETRVLRCDGCNLVKDYLSGGYRCFPSELVFHKECAESSLEIRNHYHPQHSLHIKIVAPNEDVHGECKICRGKLLKMYYHCSICDFAIDLLCARKEVMITIEDPKNHEHPLSLVPNMIMFTCHICELLDDRFPYACNKCDLSFHKDCAESTPELNYSCHPKHPLKRLTCVPSYTDGKCCLCGSKLHNLFYHCSICNFSVDVDCAKNPPHFTLDHPKAHEHPLILMPQRSFVCNACGMDDDPNPYVCRECNFMIHRNCIDIPGIIKISRHVHRIYYKHCLDAGDWKCGVCRKEINWTCGAYSCLECSDFAIHLRCATKRGIWDGIELEDTSEDTIEVKSYEVIEEGVIKHFSHKEHTLKLKEAHNGLKLCGACQNISQGFYYLIDNVEIGLDVRCGSISEPFVHESHPLHSLYINYSTGDKICSACGDKATMVLSCEECGFVLDIKCSILPKMVKHKNDKDHFLFLCYGEQTSEQYWCEICEEILEPAEKWFYSCNYCGITFHVRCTLGDFIWIKPRGTSDGYFMIYNNRINRPVCDVCNSRCQLPTILKLGRETFCSLPCLNKKFESVVFNIRR